MAVLQLTKRLILTLYISLEWLCWVLRQIEIDRFGQEKLLCDRATGLALSLAVGGG